ncbi:hypothetical protein ML462_13300 [Gramella lutea]|uniref:Uncharacterized protein n=1 Tax=Christiangramia lutea TaxID=1607951 RepID=A0A9X1V4R4_9FLAO|nr:hypothetical protein [Christiangramia lutea]MCH4824149.1 hypothetical protein [Christiangramia lutea]
MKERKSIQNAINNLSCLSCKLNSGMQTNAKSQESIAVRIPQFRKREYSEGVSDNHNFNFNKVDVFQLNIVLNYNI